MTAVTGRVGCADVAVRASVSAPTRTSMRLTRRGKVVVWVGVLLLALGVWRLGGAAAADVPAQNLPTYTVAVQAGDTLWSLAQEVTPEGGDVRDTIYRIMDANSMGSPDLRVGQVLSIPYLDQR